VVVLYSSSYMERAVGTYSGCHINFIPDDCSCICHRTYWFTYIHYLDTELYPVVQSGKYTVLCMDHSLYSSYVILNSLLKSCPQLMFALHTFLSGGVWSPN
jgi:hypothetical protein